MKTYLLTSKRFTGAVSFRFDDEGYLVSYDMTEAELDEAQKLFILKKLPRHIDLIRQVLGKSRDAKLQIQKVAKVTFDMFWDAYGEKTRSSKKKSLQIWNRFSQAKRDRAYNFIERYERNLLGGTAKKYAETYLRSEIWEN